MRHTQELFELPAHLPGTALGLGKALPCAFHPPGRLRERPVASRVAQALCHAPAFPAAAPSQAGCCCTRCSHRLSCVPLAGRLGLGRDIGLGWASPWPLAGHHGAAQEELAAPYAPRFLALQGAGEAGDPHWAFEAHGLGCLDVLRGLCEEQVRALGARQHGPGARQPARWPWPDPLLLVRTPFPAPSCPMQRRWWRASTCRSPLVPLVLVGLLWRRSRGPGKYLRPRTRFGSAAFWGSRPVFLDRIPSRMRTRVVAVIGGDAGHFLVRRAVWTCCGRSSPGRAASAAAGKDTTGAGGQRAACGQTGTLCARSKRPGTPLAGSLAKKHAVAQCGHLLPQDVVWPTYGHGSSLARTPLQRSTDLSASYR